jgi:hypothetical protein
LNASWKEAVKRNLGWDMKSSNSVLYLPYYLEKRMSFRLSQLVEQYKCEHVIEMITDLSTLANNTTRRALDIIKER